jgi:exodeoxyribonuclease VII large subunit
MAPFKPLTITQVTQVIADALAVEPRLKDVWLEGEVSNFKRPQSGHAYFTLKDSASQLKCVMWRSSVARLPVIPSDGDRVRAHGKIEVYADGGTYQLYADALEPSGIGDLYQQLERLKAKLQAEGLFEAAHKRELPLFPEVIGVVTSPSAAAFQDIQNVLRRRYPVARVLLSPTPVQGADAPPQIVRALEALAEDGRPQVIILARGGGSIEELWAFNDERVARAVYGSSIPVVTGVGHEIDFTLVDFVADRRAPTPSAAAELVTPDQDALQIELAEMGLSMTGAMRTILADQSADLAAQARALVWLSPRKYIENQQQRLDDLAVRALTAMNRQIERQRERISAQTRALDAANPASLLGRGYAIVARAGDGKRLVNALDAAPGTAISVTLGHGQLRAVVKDRTLPSDDDSTVLPKSAS